MYGRRSWRGKAGLDQHEARLHEHDEEARDQRPDIIDRIEIVRDAIVEIAGLQLIGNITFAVARGRCPDAGGSSGRIRPCGWLLWIVTCCGEITRQLRRRRSRGCRSWCGAAGAGASTFAGLRSLGLLAKN